MLIKSLSAKNFRKYNKLEIEDVPEKGVITIAGLNESGKTSIGEAICFALFGRTFFLDEKNLHKIIGWGRDSSEVTLKFTMGGSENYTLFRSIDRKGSAQVELKKDGTTQVLLDTEEQVSEALLKILGYDYDAFENSFYLVQRELTTPDPQSDTIKKMAGIGDYSRVNNELLGDNEKKEETIAELSPKVLANQTELDAINLDETWLPELIDAENTIGIEQREREEIVGALDDNEDTYSHNIGLYNGAKKRRNFFGFLNYALIPIVAILGFLWAMKKYYPERVQSVMNDKLSEVESANVFAFFDTWLLPLIIVLFLVYLLSLFIKSRAKSSMLQLSDEAQGLGNTLHEGHRHITTQVENILPERVVQAINKRTKNKNSTLLLLPPREQFANLRQLVEDAPSYNANPEEMTAAISRLSSAIKKQDGEVEDIGRGLLDDINEEKIRSDEAGKLRSTIKQLGSLVNKCQRNIDVNHISIGLLQRAAINSISVFNKNISEISAKTLPKFTENRYKEVRIAEDLSVQVYSDDKKGYMDFDEISSGTQRQVMLALRMAMSEELANNTGNSGQFIFLDEPFAFFDQKRTKSTLKALPGVSEVITQIWVVAQEFPDDVEVNKAIICPLESTELLV